MSSRPTATQRLLISFGKDSNMVLRPSGSLRVQTSPSGLLYIITRGASAEEAAVTTMVLPSS